MNDKKNLSPDPIDRCVLQMFAAYDSDPLPPMREIRKMAIACVMMLRDIYDEENGGSWDYPSPDEWLEKLLENHQERSHARTG